MSSIPSAPDSIGIDALKLAVDNKSVAVVDVREPDEFAAGHIPGAVNLPLSRFSAGDLPTDRPIVLNCRSGGRSLKALGIARAAGHFDIVHFPGGFLGWQAASGAIEREG